MVMNRSYALARESIIRALTAYTGITTADGAVTNDTLIDVNLIGMNDFLTEKTILIGSGPAAYEDKGASAFNPATGEITVLAPFSARIMAGTLFRVLNISSVELDVALILARIGSNTDPAGTTTLFAWMARLFGSAGSAGGLCFSGVVTAIPGANEFTIPTLAGLGAVKFIDLAGVTPYYAFVLRDAAGGGAAPQGESQAITNYATATGSFMTNAFSVPVAIGDEILIIHPFLARIMNLYGLPPHTGNLPGNWQTAETNVVQIGAANTKYKLHSLLLDINALVGTVTIRLYMLVNGIERRVYQQGFTVAADGPGLWIVNGTLGIHEVLRVTAESDNAADNGAVIGYDYMLEVM
jgi:hypothetical protein